MKIYLSEFGKHSLFETLDQAIDHCKRIGLIKDNYVSDDFLIWINGESRKEMDAWRLQNEKMMDHNCMRIAYREKNQGPWDWEWDSIDEKWDNYQKDLK